jgi:O-antigen/teichoic acid export membrane protein
MKENTNIENNKAKNTVFDKLNLFISGKINRSNERSTNAVKNIIASFGIKGVSIIVQLLLVPLTINYVNPTQYGIWLTLSSIIGWFSFFDIGFGNGLRNRFAEAKATGDYAKAKAYVSTTYICIGVIFAVVWILFFGINSFLDWSKILNAPAQMAKELSVVALIVISFFCLQMVFKLINTVLIADQKPAKSAFFDMLGQVLALLIIFVLTKTTEGSLIYLALALGFCPILIMVVSSFWFYKRDYKQFKPAVSWFDGAVVRDIVGLGGKFFLIQVAFMIIYQTNNIVITQICGPEDVTVYNVAYKYFSVVQMVCLIILSPFWSAFTDAYALKDFRWMKSVRDKLNYVCIVLSIIAAILLSVAKIAYHLWVGDSVHIPFALSLLVCIYIIIILRQSVLIPLINGLGKIKLQLYCNVTLCLLNIPVTVFLGLKWGLMGIVLGNIIITLPHIIYSPIQLNKILNNTAKGIWNK